MRIGIVGGGLSGLTCSIRLAQAGQQVELFEAAPRLGGRTRSFYENKVGQWVDHGPHLMIGAYQATRRLLKEVGADKHVTWQPSLRLPLWHASRGRFCLAPIPKLPIALSLPWAVFGLPGHGMASVFGMLRLAGACRRSVQPEQSVRDWLAAHSVPQSLCRDLIEPLCLGIMNEGPNTADASSFSRVMDLAFTSRDTARLGWFSGPLSEVLIKPLETMALDLGVKLHSRCRIRRLIPDGKGITLEKMNQQADRFDSIILTLPAQARNKLLGISQRVETSPITNIHLWFEADIRLPDPVIGGIGTHGHWYFDVSRQFHETSGNLHHLCAVISADEEPITARKRIGMIRLELADILGMSSLPAPFHSRIITEHHATALVRNKHAGERLLPGIIDASEQPAPGDLPATIEAAIRRGDMAARQVLQQD